MQECFKEVRSFTMFSTSLDKFLQGQEVIGQGGMALNLKERSLG